MPLPVPENPFYDTLLDALRLRAGLRINYAEDVRWLFQLRLWDWLEQVGYPVTREHNNGLNLRRDSICQLPGAALVYETDVKASPHHILDAEYCRRYFCLDDYSFQAMNYAHHRRVHAQPADYVARGPLSLGSFGAVVARKHLGDVPRLPGALRTSAYAEAPFRRTRSILAWLGVWLDTEALPRAFVRQIQSLPAIEHGWPEDKGRRHGSWFGHKVALHYGKPGDDEATVRQALGFKPKGGFVSEEILYRSACEIFSPAAVKRRYRGRELQGLEIDIWMPALRLGLEYQGEQHTKHVPLWHGQDGLQRQQERDERKRLLCTQLGYRILYFFPHDWLDKTSVLQRIRRENIVQPEFEPGETE